VKELRRTPYLARQDVGIGAPMTQRFEHWGALVLMLRLLFHGELRRSYGTSAPSGRESMAQRIYPGSGHLAV
jgi:hypothetical protein